MKNNFKNSLIKLSNTTVLVKQNDNRLIKNNFKNRLIKLSTTIITNPNIYRPIVFLKQNKNSLVLPLLVASFIYYGYNTHYNKVTALDGKINQDSVSNQIIKDINKIPSENKNLSYYKLATLFIKQQEGYSSKWYDLGDGTKTIGWGTTSKEHPKFYKNNKHNHITQAQADSLFKVDYTIRYNAVSNFLQHKYNVSYKADNGKISIITALTYNLGIGILKRKSKGKSLIGLILRGKHEALKKYNHARINGTFRVLRGLTLRRDLEVQILTSVHNNDTTTLKKFVQKTKKKVAKIYNKNA